MTTPLYFDNFCLRFNSNLNALEYNTGNEVWVPVPVPTGDLALTNDKILVGNASNLAAAVTMSGDATIANTGVLTLANTAVTPTSYTLASITVDSKGRITAASNGSLTGPFLASSGTAGAPAYSFSAHSDTGMYLNSTTLSFSAAGSDFLRFGTSDSSINLLQYTHFSNAPSYAIASGGSSGASLTPNITTSLIYKATITADCTIHAPVAVQGITDGMKVTLRLLQDGTGHSVTFSGSDFTFGTDITSFTASGANLTDYVGIIYNGLTSKWDIVSVVQGF